jgi:hypothetical protein
MIGKNTSLIDYRSLTVMQQFHMQTLFKIKVNNVFFDQPDAIHLQQELKRAHKKNQSFCHCRPSHPIPLVVKHYNGDSDASFYGLALWPETNFDHEPECFFFDKHSEDAHSDPEIEDRPAFEELPGGKSRAYLDTALNIINKNIRAIEARKANESQTSTRRRRANDLTLLLKLWRQAGLNVFKGNPRSWYQAVFVLLRAAGQIVINKNGESLSDFLLIGGSSSDKVAIEHNQAVLQRAQSGYTRLFVIGRLRGYTRDKSRQMLSLKDFGGIPRISTTLDQLDRGFDSDPTLKQLTSDDDADVIVIACIEPSSNEWWTTLHLHAFATNKSLLPVSNLAERDFSNFLVEQNRKFMVPIVLEQTDAPQRPQFLLLDTAQRTYCEVFDKTKVRDPDQVNAKTQLYQARQQSYIAWYSGTDQNITIPSPFILNNDGT